MEHTSAATLMQAKKRAAVTGKIWAGACNIVTGGLALYTAAMSWDAIRGLIRNYQMNALLAGKFEHETTTLSSIVHITDIVSCIVLMMAWMILVLTAQGVFEKAYTKGKLLPVAGKLAGVVALILAAALTSGMVFGGKVPGTAMIIQAALAAVTGIGLCLVPRFIKRKT